jgi:hypothetical protein
MDDVTHEVFLLCPGIEYYQSYLLSELIIESFVMVVRRWCEVRIVFSSVLKDCFTARQAAAEAIKFLDVWRQTGIVLVEV